MSSASASTAEYHLTYFNSRGLGELIRMIFAVAKQPFEDERVPIGMSNGAVVYPEWAAKKSDRQQFPFGQIPVLRLSDGSIIAQSRAIQRFLAKRFGLFGKTDVQGGQVDSLLEQIVDVRKAYSDANASAKKDEGAAMNTFLSKSLPASLLIFEDWLQRRPSSSTAFLVGDALSVADVALYYFLWVLENGSGGEVEKKGVLEALKQTPKVQALKDAVASLPQLQEYEAKRPVTAF